MIFVDAPRSEDELRAIGAAGIGKPLLVNVSEYGRTPDLGAAAFAAARLLDRAVSDLDAVRGLAIDEGARGRRCTRAARRASIVPRMMPFDELNETLGKDDWDVNP